MIPVESESAPEYLNRKNVIYWRDSMRTIAWQKQGSRKQWIENPLTFEKEFKFPFYDCTVKVDDKTKLIMWIDCTCWNFVNRRMRVVGDYADKKVYAEPCKHLKLVVDALIKNGYELKQPKAMDGPDKMTAEVRKGVLDRSGGICEFPECQYPGQTFHRNVRGSNGGKYTIDNVRHLCLKHHKFIHGNEFPGVQGK